MLLKRVLIPPMYMYNSLWAYAISRWFMVLGCISWVCLSSGGFALNLAGLLSCAVFPFGVVR